MDQQTKTLIENLASMVSQVADVAIHAQMDALTIHAALLRANVPGYDFEKGRDAYDHAQLFLLLERTRNLVQQVRESVQ
jgi:hypothetical protein